MPYPISDEGHIIPPQQTGLRSGAGHMVRLSNEADAKVKFREAKQRILAVNSWAKLSGAGSAEFTLMDSGGKKIKRKPVKGDLIRIDLPGPGPTSGDGFDWVRIEAIEESSDEASDIFAIRVRPVKAPGSEKVAHFYTDSATSTFMIRRQGKMISASEEGRNEHVNTHEQAAADKIRNTLVAAGAHAGLAAFQWKNLVKGFLA